MRQSKEQFIVYIKKKKKKRTFYRKKIGQSFLFQMSPFNFSSLCIPRGTY